MSMQRAEILDGVPSSLVDIATAKTNIQNLQAIQPQKTTQFIYFKTGATYKAINGNTGIVDYTGSDGSTVLQNAITAGNVFLKTGSYDLNTTITIPQERTLDGEDRTRTILNWTGAADEKVLTTADAQVILKNFFIDCQGVAGYGFYTAPASTKWSVLLQDLGVYNAKNTCVHVAANNLPQFNRVICRPYTEAGKAFFCTTSFYPKFKDCSGTSSAGSGLEVTYCNAPTVDAGSYSKINFYRCYGSLLSGLDLEALLADNTSEAMLIGGEATYGTATVLGGIISNEKNASCVGLRVYGGMTVALKGTQFLGTNLTTDIQAVDNSLVEIQDVKLKANAVTGNVHQVGLLPTQARVPVAGEVNLTILDSNCVLTDANFSGSGQAFKLPDNMPSGVTFTFSLISGYTTRIYPSQATNGRFYYAGALQANNVFLYDNEVGASITVVSLGNSTWVITNLVGATWSHS